MRTALALAFAILLAPPAGAQDEEKKPEKWDVAAPAGEISEIAIDVSEGTWMSLDVSLDGRTIAFDLLGDIYTLPINGGEARAIASGLAWDMQPRFSPDGREIAFISDRSGGENVWTMQLDGSAPAQVTKEDFRLLGNPVWSPDGRFIAARKHFTTRRSLGTGEIWLYARDGGSGVQLVERPNPQFQKELGEPIFAPDGKHLYFTQNTTPGNTFEYAQDSNSEIFRIRRYDMATRATDDIVTGPGGAVRPTPSPDGKYLAFVRRIRTEPALFLKDLTSGAERPIYRELDRDMQETWATQGVYPNMAWTPDSSAIVFWAGGKIRRIEIASGAVGDIPFHVKNSRQVVAPPRFSHEVAPDSVTTHIPRFATVAPDGKRAVYEAFGRLWIKTLPDGKPERLTRDSEDKFELFPAFSRDGKQVAFVAWSDAGLGELRTVAASGGRSRLDSPEPGHYANPVWSPDGKTLVVERREGGGLLDPGYSHDPGLYALPAAGGALVRLTDGGREPHFGANGDRLFFIRDGGGKHKLVSTDANGKDERVHASSEYGTDFAVSPDGNWLAFSEGYQVYALAMPLSGEIELSPKAKALPMKRLSKPAGRYMRWVDGDTLSFTLGATLHRVDMKEAFADGFEPPATGADLAVSLPADRPEGLVALTGARILTMDADRRVIENGTVLVERNRIKAVGAAGEIEIPAAAKRVDVAGKTILPGFIDIHAHGPQGSGDIVPQQNWAQLAHLGLGVTTVHDPSNRATHIFPAGEYQRAGLILGPRVFSTGEIIYGAKSEFFIDINTIDDARDAINRLAAEGAISVKNYNQPRRDQRQMVVAAAREAGLNVVAEGGSLYHMDMTLVADGNTGVEHNVPPGRFYEDMLQFWSGTRVGYTPTLIVTYGGIRGEDLFYQESDVWQHPLLSRFVPPFVLEPRSVRRQMAPMKDYQAIRDSAANADRLRARGVSVHTGAHGQREGLGTHWELWAFVMGGMSEMNALAAATIAPARYMGFERDLGSLEPGKLADILVLDGNPLDDIRTTDKLSRIMLNGRLYDPASLAEQVTGDRRLAPFYWQR